MLNYLFLIIILQLSKDVDKKVEEVFALFDADGSKEIDKAEAVKHWKSKFGQISAN